MKITVTRDTSRLAENPGSMKHHIHIRDHAIIADEDVANGGEDSGPSPHDLYDSALGACKALTMLWYAKRKQIPLASIDVSVERDASDERNGTYRLKTLVALGGDLSDAQRAELLNVAKKCPVHKLMTQVTTEIETDWLV